MRAMIKVLPSVKIRNRSPGPDSDVSIVMTDPATAS